MASTFTPNLNLEKPARGDKVGSWDTAVNSNFDLIDTSVNVKIELTDLSVTVGAAGSANLSYNNTTGAFTYTPPDLSSYLTSVAFADLTSTPTTLSGYGITDALQDGDTVSSLDINGGTIDGTVIGGTTPAAGTFTTLQSDDGEAYAPENILGTVSESSGTPTGAIIERGSNANGEYVKFADGTMICTGSGATQTTDSAWSATMYINDPGLTISFPATFIAAPYVACTRTDDTVSQGWAKATGIGTTGFSSFHFSASSTSTGRSEFIAVGRWF